MWQRMRTGRWLGYFAMVLVFATVCCLLGIWQWNRREEALAAIHRLDSNYDRTPQMIDEVLAETSSYDIDQQWTPVALQGTYLVDEQLLLRGRVRDGAVGFDVVVPFLTNDGTIMLVDRGWLPPGADPATPGSDPATPTGTVSVVVRLRADEGVIAGRGAPDGQIASVDLTSLAERYSQPTYTGAYGLLATEQGSEPDDVALAVRPVLDEGPHLSYCLQWFVFALLGISAYFWALRREVQFELEAAGERAPTVRKRMTDADIEDDILDRAGY